MSYIMALDAGTTSNRCILFNKAGEICSVAQKEFAQYYPRPGWVEHDPMEIWSSQYGVMNEVIAQSGVDPRDIAGIGITNQRETTILWDKNTGRPVYNAIVWQCRRTAPLVDELLKTPAWQTTSGKTPALCRTPISPPPRSSGSWTTSPVRGKRPRRGSFCSARWTHGWSGS